LVCFANPLLQLGVVKLENRSLVRLLPSRGAGVEIFLVVQIPPPSWSETARKAKLKGVPSRFGYAHVNIA
jgi:hypothetical protein